MRLIQNEIHLGIQVESELKKTSGTTFMIESGMIKLAIR